METVPSDVSIIPRPPTQPRNSRPGSRTQSDDGSEDALASIYEKTCLRMHLIVIPSVRMTLIGSAPEVLDFSTNYIGNSSLVALCSCIPSLSSLRKVILPRNGIRNEGVKALCGALKDINIIEIDLRDNKISDSGASELIPFMESKVSLKKLCIEGNPIHPRDRIRIKDMNKKRCPGIE